MKTFLTGAAEKGGKGCFSPCEINYGGLAPSKISVAMVESLEIF